MKVPRYLFLVVLLPSLLFAAIHRPFEPVVVKGSQLSEYSNKNVPLNNILLIAYDGAKWKFIPCQIDEKDIDSPKGYFGQNDGLFGNLDEVVFMAKDAGEKLPDNWWVGNPDPTSIKYPRLEIKVTDPLTGDVGYVYLFRTDTPEIYVNWPKPKYFTVDEADDRITSDFYTLDHDGTRGNMRELKIPVSENGSWINFLERLKMRVEAKVNVGIEITLRINEDMLTKTPGGNEYGNNSSVRIIRKWNIQITLNLFVTTQTFSGSFISTYYPHWVDFGQETIKIEHPDYDIKLNYLRYSMDLNSSANGMKAFASSFASNPALYLSGLTINRNPTGDGLASSERLFIPGSYAWWMQTGNPGTILSISKIPDIGDVQQIYYKDDASGTNDDISSSDTGDKESWGDTGAKFHGNITSNEIQMATRMYFLGSGVDPDSAESIKESIENPLNVSVSSYNYPVPVELAGFDISAFKNQISLTWSTATETNNLGFDIERRFKGDADYQKIGFVEGAGTTTKQQFYTFHDTAGDVGTVYYRLKQIDTGGAFQYYEKNIVVFPPDRFMLAQNFPNPFNPSTTIGYEIAGDGDRLAIDVYDLLGRYVRSLVRENSRAGYHTAFWDGRDEQGQIVGSGVYMCVLTCGTTRITKKMIKLQ